MTDELDRYLVERDAALATLDMAWARRMMPQATDDETRLGAMHKARYEVKSMPADLRHASARWLRERGFGRLGGMPLLPEGELPS